MGTSSSSILTKEELEDYVELTYLTKSEILHILNRFRHVGPEVDNDRCYRYPISKVMEILPELNHNPFKDRISYVFSSQKDDCFSFEDILDLASAFSENCPIEVRAKWAFLIYDFDNDHRMNKNDIVELLARITGGGRSDIREVLEEAEKEKIANLMLDVIDLDGTGSISAMEFLHALTKIPEFSHTFRIKL